MESLLIASGVYTIPAEPAQSIKVDYIQCNMPATDVGITDPTITLSGSYTGSYTFHLSGPTDINIRFKPNETVTLTTTNFAATYNATVSYVYVGDQSMYMNADPTRRHIPVWKWQS